MIIESFADTDTEGIYNGDEVKGKPKDIQKRARNKMRLIRTAISIDDLKNPPSNRFERLQGRLKDFYSVRVNQKRRIIFMIVENKIYKMKLSKHYQN